MQKKGRENSRKINFFRFIMGDFANGLPMKIISVFLSIAMIAINIFFCYDQVTAYLDDSTHWIIFVLLGSAVFIYAIFVTYLFVFMLINLGMESLTKHNFIRKIYRVEEFVSGNSTPKILY